MHDLISEQGLVQQPCSAWPCLTFPGCGAAALFVCHETDFGGDVLVPTRSGLALRGDMQVHYALLNVQWCKAASTVDRTWDSFTIADAPLPKKCSEESH